jgi:hypothetical protein
MLWYLLRALALAAVKVLAPPCIQSGTPDEQQ